MEPYTERFIDLRPFVLCSCKRNFVKHEADCPDCAKERGQDCGKNVVPFRRPAKSDAP